MKRFYLLILTFLAGVISAAAIPAVAHPPVLPKSEGARSTEQAHVKMQFPSDGAHFHPSFVLRKYNHAPKDTDPGFTLENLHKWIADHPIPDETITRTGNLTITAGINIFLSKGIGGAGQTFDHANCAVAVGDGTGTASAGATDISAVTGAAHRWNQQADATYPQLATNTLTIVVTVTSSNAQFAWNEWAINNAAAADLPASTLFNTYTTRTPTMLNWKTGANLGIKGAATWTGTWTYSVS